MRRLKKMEFIAPFVAALLVQASACTIWSSQADGEKSTTGLPSNAPGNSDPQTPGASWPGTKPSSSAPGSNQSTSAPQNPNPGSSQGTSAPDSSSSQEPGEEPEADPDECQDGEVDRNCHAREDGSAIEFPGGVPMGNCKAGTRVCEGNRWGPCKGAIAPEAKDNCEKTNDDATCDGIPNAGCDCVTGETRECGTNNIGACKLGTQRCIDGKWDEACEGVINPSPEICDGKGIDEDCNKTADLDDEKCECINDSSEYCQRAKRKGDCKWGRRSCSEGAWGRCEDWAKPETEVCGSRPAVEGIIWTGDENCDGKIDASDIGKPGPKGCIDMMLDQDRDGYGKIGMDLSEIKITSSLSLIGTACLCPNRPDIDVKRKEGWTEATFRVNRDCGDCAAPLDDEGREAYPGSTYTTVLGNDCLRQVRWTVGPLGIKDGSFDLDCNRVHEDPADNGQLRPLRCRPSGALSCAPAGKGRLILPLPERELRCGRLYDFGRCAPIIVEEPAGSVRRDDDTTDDGTTTEEPKPKKKLEGCRMEPTGRQHRIRCR